MANSREELRRRDLGAYSESTLTVLQANSFITTRGTGSTTTGPGGDSWISRAANGL